MVTLTAEQAQQIEEALDKLNSVYGLHETPCVAKALSTIRAARAQEQAEQDLDTCPGCGGVADNGHDREFPPNPYYCTKCSEQAEQDPVSDYFDFGLEEVEDYLRNCCNSPFMADKLSEIRKSISEPFAYAFSKNETWLFSLFEQPDSIPLYAAPVQQVDLTDDEIDAIDDANWENENKTWNIKKFARAVIASDREKNNANNNT